MRGSRRPSRSGSRDPATARRWSRVQAGDPRGRRRRRGPLNTRCEWGRRSGGNQPSMRRMAMAAPMTAARITPICASIAPANRHVRRASSSARSALVAMSAGAPAAWAHGANDGVGVFGLDAGGGQAAGDGVGVENGHASPFQSRPTAGSAVRISTAILTSPLSSERRRSLRRGPGFGCGGGAQDKAPSPRGLAGRRRCTCRRRRARA